MWHDLQDKDLILITGNDQNRDASAREPPFAKQDRWP
jgi:hypothetical protein